MKRYGHLYKSLSGVGVALVCFLLLLPSFHFFPVGAQSTTLSDASREQEIEARIHTFFNALMRSNSATAFEGLLSQSPYSSFETGTVLPELRKEVDDLSDQYGNILNYEKFVTKRIGEDIVLSQYILKCDKGPVIWTFAFYRKPAMPGSISSGAGTWMFVQLHFDTDLRTLL